MNKHWPHKQSKHPSNRRKAVKPFEFFRKANDNQMKGVRNMEKFYELLGTSVIFQGLITTALVLTICYLWIIGREVPAEAWTALTVVLGFFFGAKTHQATVTKIQKGGKKDEL